MKKITSLFVALMSLLLMLSSCGFGAQNANNTSVDTNTIIVSSKNYSENMLVANMMYLLLKENLDGVTIEKKLNLGSTLIPWNALLKGEVSMYPEYTGTGLVNILKKEAAGDAEEIYNTVKKEFSKQYGIDWLKPIGFENTYAIAVEQETADKYNLKTISDLAKVASELRFGGEGEFFTRPDGLEGLNKTYGIKFKSTKQVDITLRFDAIATDQVDVIDVASTEAKLKEYDLVVLEDDKNLFPPYHAAPIVRQDILKAHPEISTILNKLEGKIDDATMLDLNYQVDVEGKSVDEVSKQFLVSEGLLKA